MPAVLSPGTSTRFKVQEIETFEVAIAAAARVEASITDAKRRAVISEVKDETVEELRAQINSLKSQINANQKSASAGFRPAVQCPEKKRPGWLKNSMLPANTCYKCGMKNHVAFKCKVSEKNHQWPDRVREIKNAKQVDVETEEEQQYQDDPAF